MLPPNEPNSVTVPSLVHPTDRAAFRAALRETFRRLAEATGVAGPTCNDRIAPPDADRRRLA